MTRIEIAKQNKEEACFREIAKAESINEDELRSRIAAGVVVIPSAKGSTLTHTVAVGDGLKCKVNANIGTSPDHADVDEELCKLKAAVDAGADAVMDLSTGGNLREIRKRIRDNCFVSLGSVPLYESGYMAIQRGQKLRDMTENDMLEAIRLHIEDGVDFITVHCGLTLRAIEHLKTNPRICGIVSRGGSLIARWMALHKKENPLFERFDEVIDMCRERDVTLSLGDALRPGAIADAGDRAQIEELYTLGDLAKRAKAKGVQVMIEGPGHVPFHQIQSQMALEKKACAGAPFYVLGPLVTDIAPGYDHITAAIGGTLAASSGANFICYVTPSEHLRLPTADDVIDGVIAARIAAHAADIANGIPGAIDWDIEMSKARKLRDWDAQAKLAINPNKVFEARKQYRPSTEDVCTMCGEFCAMKDDCL